MRWFDVLAVLCLATPASPCLVFCISDGKHVFAGNNEDYTSVGTRMWVVPAEAGEHGRVYFGYADGFPQGGVNDAGLFFDGLALEHEVVPQTDKPVFAGNLIDRSLAQCTSVKQVVELFERYDRTFLADAQLLFGDKKGESVVIEGNAVHVKQGSYSLATNCRPSATPAPIEVCERYQAASAMLGAAREVTVDLCRRVLSATHQEGPVSTLYSNVYDLKKGLIYLYHFHDYDNVVVINVAEELAKGAHVVELSPLFPRTFAFATFERQAEAELAALREQERNRSVDPKTFRGLEGRFRVRDGDAAGFEFVVHRQDEKIFADFPDQKRSELIPRGGSSFVCISATARAELSFLRDKDGVAQEVTVRQDEVELRALKVE